MPKGEERDCMSMVQLDNAKLDLQKVREMLQQVGDSL
jgi:hypothetical protein